jgi:hypothetical protein
LSNSWIDKDTWERGLELLSNVGKNPEGTFFYTWFKALAYK